MNGRSGKKASGQTFYPHTVRSLVPTAGSVGRLRFAGRLHAERRGLSTPSPSLTSRGQFGDPGEHFPRGPQPTGGCARILGWRRAGVCLLDSVSGARCFHPRGWSVRRSRDRDPSHAFGRPRSPSTEQDKSTHLSLTFIVPHKLTQPKQLAFPGHTKLH